VNPQTPHSPDVELLTRLGFAPGNPLMTEPRVLVDRSFLSRLRTELDETLDADTAHRVRSQIGLFHGLREGRRAVSRARDDVVGGVVSRPDTPSIAMTLLARGGCDGLEIHGEWPHSAEARATDHGGARNCVLAAGYTSGWLSEICGSTLVAVETECRAQGQARCAFVARPAEEWRARHDAEVEQFVDSLPFETFRTLLRENSARGLGLGAEGHSPLGATPWTAHVWGPVMVLPFQSSVTALRDLENDCGIRVVVVDLRTAYTNGLEEKSLRASLEKFLDHVSSWGVESVLAAPPPAVESLLPELRNGPHVARPTLPEAISTAFQIAHANRSGA